MGAERSSPDVVDLVAAAAGFKRQANLLARRPVQWSARARRRMII